ncbi:MAG TPA: flagellar basal body-associated FliL family protein [Alphaproteobacteria bacterium]|nr:flagellar basal body-associated FliL family protein [Alphaproteobacteria bacterium]
MAESEKPDKKAEKDADADKKPAEGEAAEGAEGEGGDGEEGGKKKLSKKMLIIVAAGAFLVLGAGGGGAAFYFMHGKKPAAATAESDAASKPVFYSLGDLLVNLSGEGTHPHFLKVKVTLELASPKDVPLIDAIKPRIIDNFQVYLRELRIEDLRGSAGMYRLREELLRRVDEAAQPIRIRDVLFEEMLVQ